MVSAKLMSNTPVSLQLNTCFWICSGTLVWCYVLCLVSQSCTSLCDPMDCSLPGCSVHGDSPGKNTGMRCHALLQGIFSTQGLNPGLLHCRQILYHLRHQGSPRILQWIAYPFSRGRSPGSNWSFRHCRQILCQLSYQGSPYVTIYLSKSTEYTTPKVNCNVNYGLWIIMACQCRLILGFKKKKYHSGEKWWWERLCIVTRDSIWKSCVPFSQLCKP